jgi:hypothetical protein
MSTRPGIHLAAVSDLHDLHRAALVVDSIDHALVSLPDAIAVLT